MSTAFDLAAEMRRRDVGTTELARRASVARSTVARIREKRSQGHPRTRRVLRATLALYPPLEEQFAAISEANTA